MDDTGWPNDDARITRMLAALIILAAVSVIGVLVLSVILVEMKAIKWQLLKVRDQGERLEIILKEGLHEGVKEIGATLKELQKTDSK